jgi:hypothetical protein
MSVGVMKDYKLKLRNLSASHTRLIDEKFANSMGEYVTER